MCVSPCTCREAFLSTITIICVAVSPDLICVVLGHAQAAFQQNIHSRDPPVSPHTKQCKITKWRGFLFLSVIDYRDKPLCFLHSPGSGSLISPCIPMGDTLRFFTNSCLVNKNKLTSQPLPVEPVHVSVHVLFTVPLKRVRLCNSIHALLCLCWMAGSFRQEVRCMLVQSPAG